MLSNAWGRPSVYIVARPSHRGLRFLQAGSDHHRALCSAPSRPLHHFVSLFVLGRRVPLTPIAPSKPRKWIRHVRNGNCRLHFDPPRPLHHRRGPCSRTFCPWDPNKHHLLLMPIMSQISPLYGLLTPSVISIPDVPQTDCKKIFLARSSRRKSGLIPLVF